MLELGEDLVPRAAPEPLTAQGQEVFAPAWSADGKELIYTSSPGDFGRLWRIDASGGGEPELLAFAGSGATTAKVARQGQRLVYVRESTESNIWAIEKGGAPRVFVPSTYYDATPKYSPDGSKVAFASMRSGHGEIWVSRKDGNHAVQLTRFGRGFSGAPRWSPDGRFIAFDSTAEDTRDIYVISSDGGKPRRLTDGMGHYVVPSWSRDGLWIYFCKQGDTDQIWRIPVDGGEAVQVTKNGGAVGFESVDGKHLFYMRKTKTSGLWKLPLPGGEETMVLESVQIGSFQPFEDGMYYTSPTDADGANSIRFLDFATGQSREIAKIEARAFVRYSLGVAPDRKTFLYTQWEEPNSDLMLVENFR